MRPIYIMIALFLALSLNGKLSRANNDDILASILPYSTRREMERDLKIEKTKLLQQIRMNKDLVNEIHERECPYCWEPILSDSSSNEAGQATTKPEILVSVSCCNLVFHRACLKEDPHSAYQSSTPVCSVCRRNFQRSDMMEFSEPALRQAILSVDIDKTEEPYHDLEEKPISFSMLEELLIGNLEAEEIELIVSRRREYEELVISRIRENFLRLMRDKLILCQDHRLFNHKQHYIQSFFALYSSLISPGPVILEKIANSVSARIFVDFASRFFPQDKLLPFSKIALSNIESHLHVLTSKKINEGFWRATKEFLISGIYKNSAQNFGQLKYSSITKFAQEKHAKTAQNEVESSVRQNLIKISQQFNSLDPEEFSSYATKITQLSVLTWYSQNPQCHSDLFDVAFDDAYKKLFKGRPSLMNHLRAKDIHHQIEVSPDLARHLDNGFFTLFVEILEAVHSTSIQ